MECFDINEDISPPSFQTDTNHFLEPYLGWYAFIGQYYCAFIIYIHTIIWIFNLHLRSNIVL